MKQRPKQASYLQNMEQRGGGAQNARLGKQGSAVVGAGRMTKFRSLDDIPDGLVGPSSSRPDSRDHCEDESTNISDGKYRGDIEPDDVYSSTFLQNESFKKNNYGITHDMRSQESLVERTSGLSLSPNPAAAVPRRSSRGPTAAAELDVPFARSSPPCESSLRDDDNSWDEYDERIADSERKGGGYLRQYAEAEPISARVPNSLASQKQQEHTKTSHLQRLLQQPVTNVDKSEEYTCEEEQLYFSRNPRKIHYRPYTLEQYKAIRPNTYVEYTNLKPDLNTDELKAKRANADRVRDFSKKLREYNKEAIQTRATSPIDTNAGGAVPSRRVGPSARDRALEFARNVPKPRVRADTGSLVRGVATKGRESESNNYGSSAEENYLSWGCSGAAGENADLDVALRAVLGAGGGERLQELEQRHGENQRKVNAIKKSLGL